VGAAGIGGTKITEAAAVPVRIPPSVELSDDPTASAKMQKESRRKTAFFSSVS